MLDIGNLIAAIIAVGTSSLDTAGPGPLLTLSTEEREKRREERN